MKKYLIISGVIVIIIILGVIYNQSRISIWGFNIPKSDLTDVIIYTGKNNYMVTDPNLVLSLSKEVSKMKKFSKIDPSNFPLNKKQPSKFFKLLIQTKNKSTYGGSFWDNGNNEVLDSNGYYWVVTNNLLDLMHKSLKDAKKLD